MGTLGKMSDPVGVIQALASMGDYNPNATAQMDYSWQSVHSLWLKGQRHGLVIYGSGGVNRYYVDADGSIRFSRSHAMWPPAETSRRAQALGFVLCY